MKRGTDIVLFATLAIVLLTLALVQSGPRQDDEACDVALQVLKYLQYENDGKIAVSTGSANNLDMSRTEVEQYAAHWRSNNRMDAAGEIFLDLAIKEAAVKDVKPVEECANIRQWLDKSHIIHDDAQIDAAKAGKEIYPFTIVAISMPVLSDDRNHAQMSIAQVSGAFAGEGEGVSLKRQKNNRWRIENFFGMWIS